MPSCYPFRKKDLDIFRKKGSDELIQIPIVEPFMALLCVKFLMKYHHTFSKLIYLFF